MKRLYIIILFLISIFTCNAQKEANFWYFGNNAGLDFNSGSPVPVAGGQTSTIEGTACISDPAGNLLFYADGVTVWNKNHNAMPNGTGLSGNTSSTQSALIVQKPGSANLFYVFTTGSGTYDYSIVDMTLAAGNGDVTSKNVNMWTNSSERSTAVRMSNGVDFWIMGHESGNNTFFAFQLTAAGVSVAPVISLTGILQTNTNDDIGYLKPNPDGTKLAMAVRYEHLFEIFDFDKSTGIISNAITFPATYSTSYGVEFSPDGSRLYMSGGGSYIYQVDMTAPNPAAIIASSTLIANPVTGGAMGALMLGPDCKIYCAKYNITNIGVINDPNALGAACNYVDNQITLTSGTCQLGLPNYFEMTSCSALSFTPTCLGDTTYFSLGNTSSLAGALWDFGDPASGANNFASVFNASHFYSSAGTYTVQLIKYNLSGSTDTSYAQVDVHALPVITLGNDTTICDSTNLLIDAGSGFSSYVWQDGSTNSTYVATIAGTYWVTVTDGFCSATDSIVVSTTPCNIPAIAFSSSDTSQCEKTCIDFFDLSTNNPTSWQWFFPGADSLTSTQQNPIGICYNSYGSFDVTLIACNNAGCDTLVIQNFISIFQSPPSPTIIQNLDTLICTTIASGYQWYLNNVAIAGATQSTYVVTQQGLYYVIITDSNSCNSASNSLTINSIDQLAIGNWQLAINPNPNDGNFTLEINAKSEIGNCKSQIVNVLGEIIFSEEFKISGNAFSHKFDLQNLSAGIYLLKLSSLEQDFSTRLIIKR
ncbi:MAG: PKD domain-containing protein [Bacteroidia bacterium]